MGRLSCGLLCLMVAAGGCSFDTRGVSRRTSLDGARPQERGLSWPELSSDGMALRDLNLHDTIRTLDNDQSPSCDEIFKKSVPGYEACGGGPPGTCRFYFAATSEMSCSSLCGSHTCLKMEDNEGSQTCVPENPMSCRGSPCTCDSTMSDSICTCKK